MNNEKYAVYERNPAHGSTKNGMILGPFNSKEEAQSNGEKYGYTGDNYYVNSVNNEKYNQIIDEAYKNYAWKTSMDFGGQFTKEEFVDKYKTDSEFSEKWGLKIEERDLSEKERMNTLIQNEQRLIYEEVQSFKNVRKKKIKDCLDERNIPTKLITVTYNNEKIEVYE